MKIIVTEAQIKQLVGKLKTNKTISEGAISSEKYSNDVKVDVETYGVTINGNEIDWATCTNMDLTYNIDVEYKSWGINGIGIYNIKGPSEIEIEITPNIYDEDSFRVEPVIVNLQYDWNNVEIEVEKGRIIAVDDKIKIRLKNTENGEVAIDSITVTVFNF
jgi:hypothetical protein